MHAGVEVAHAVAARGARRQDPGRREVVLDHRDPAVGGDGLGVDGVLGLALVDVAERDLVEAVVAVDGRAGVRAGAVEVAARRRAAVAHQLQVQVGGDGRARVVDHLVRDVDGVAAAMEGVGLDQLHAADLGRLEAHRQLVLAVGQRALGAGQAHHAVLQRVAAGQAGEAGLGGVELAVAGVEHLHVGPGRDHVVQAHQRLDPAPDLAVVVGLLVLAQVEVDQVAALGVERGLDDVGLDGDVLHRQRDRGRGRGRGHQRRVVDGGRGRRGGQRHRLGGRARRQQRGLAVIDAPLVEQHQRRHHQDDQQQGAAKFGHGSLEKFYLSVPAAVDVAAPEAGGADTGAVARRQGPLSGTWSQPP